MRRFRIFQFGLVLALMAVPAHAGTGSGSVTWSSLDPGNDWASQVIKSVFPVLGSSPNIGTSSSVVGLIVSQITGFVAVIAFTWLCYGLIMQIYRGAETSRLLSSNMSSMFVVRLGFAAVMMLPQASGFSTGQSVVVQAAMWGVGMARSVYASVVTAVGPDAMTIYTPTIPGTQTVVSSLIQNELCRGLVNAASGNPNMIPVPSPITVTTSSGQLVTWSYSMSAGNEIDTPVCGTLTLRSGNSAVTQIAGVSVDTAEALKAAVTATLSTYIQPQVQQIAQNFFMTRKGTALQPLMGVLSTATADYTQKLTQAATSTTAALRSAMQSAAEARNGNVGVATGQARLADLGWSSAGAYYLEFARLNGVTLSLVSSTPEINLPSYQGLGRNLSSDLAPFVQASLSYMTRLQSYVTTTDTMSSPGGSAQLLSGAVPGESGVDLLTRLYRKIGISDAMVQRITGYMMPSSSIWTDPFGGLMQLGNFLINVALIILGGAALLASGTASTALTAWQVLTFQWAGAGATVVAHDVVNFLATPIFLGAASLLIPGLTIAFVLPMIPFVMWFAGVMGWIILVCEAVIAVPLWMLAHMTFQGEGLHGQGGEGYSLLFNVIFRPVLMLVGLFLAYFIFASGSWLIRQGFGIASGFTLSNGGMVTNILGIAVMVSIFVMMHVALAFMSFRLISLIPQIPRMIGFHLEHRVDMEQYGRDAAALGVAGTLSGIRNGILAAGSSEERKKRLQNGRGTQKQLTTGTGTSISEAVDSTTQAASDVTAPKDDPS